MGVVRTSVASGQRCYMWFGVLCSLKSKGSDSLAVTASGENNVMMVVAWDEA